MAKDYAKFVPPKPRAAKRKQWHAEIILPAFLLLAGALAGGCYYYQKGHPATEAQGQGIQGFATKVASFFSHHKKDALHLKKTLAANGEEQPPTVHFDFYSQLPSMQVTIPEEGGQPTLQEAAKPISAPVLAKLESPHQEVIPVVSQAPAAPTPASKMAAPNADEVSTLLEAEGQPVQYIKTTTQTYVIELGVFDSRQAAALLADALSGVGFKVAIVKINRNGQKMYGVQQGPFKNLDVAKSTQQRLQKRGIVGEIHKSV
jgi:cell division septation protein DedD